MRLVEGSYYKHDYYGTVKVLRLQNKYVAFEMQVDECIKTETAEEFRESASPADIHVETPTVQTIEKTPNPN